MKAPAKAVAWGRLKRRALSLGALKAFDNGLQFLLPVVLVRSLDAQGFGEYRLLWLALATVLGIASLNMGGSLYFFVPRAEGERRRVYVHQTMVYLALAGVACGLAVSAWNPWLPAALLPLERYGALVPAFVGLWVATTLLDYLPTIEERIGWQAFATLGASALRVTLLGLAAWFTGDFEILMWMLIAASLVKLALLLAYVRRWHGLGGAWLQRETFAGQLRLAAPFGVSSALYGLRGQADQWVAASLFALSSFAAFSIAALVGQVVNLIRHSVLEAFLPSMSRLEAAGDMRGMMEMNSRANAMVGLLLYPLLAFAFAFAEDILTFVYTASYVEAASAMRVYIAGMAAMVIEVGSIVLLLSEGGFALRVAALALAVSVPTSWFCAQHFGLAGAAAGSVVAIYVDRFFMLRRVSRRTGIALGRLQDWAGLARSLGLAAGSACLAWLAVERLLAGAPPLARLAAGAAVLGGCYLPFTLRRAKPVGAHVAETAP